MKRPLVAIVGRPNVGKSTLFNRLIGFRKAIVYDRPGVTRDRNITPATILDTEIDLMDTGGFEFETQNPLYKSVNDQILKGLEESSVFILVFDGKVGITPSDDHMVRKLRTFNKPMIVVINKIDVKSSKAITQEFYKYGFEKLIPISAEHDLGIEEFKTIITEELKKYTFEREVEAEKNPNAVQIAFVGRPNVGKSSIVNALINEERLTVSEVAGTTRDTIDIAFEKNGQDYVLLDTAGMRYKRKVDDDVEYFSIKRTFDAIDRADIVFLVVDSVDKLTTQDQKIASKVIERQKGFCIIVNKWDLQPKDAKTKEDFRSYLYDFSSFLQPFDVMFISAKNRTGLDTILSTAKSIFQRMKKVYAEDQLVQAYQMISSYHHEVGNAGFHLQLKGLYAITGKGKGPIFRIKCNKPHRVTETFHKYWENALTDFFQLRNVPVKVIFSEEARGAQYKSTAEQDKKKPSGPKKKKQTKKKKVEPPRKRYGKKNSRRDRGRR